VEGELTEADHGGGVTVKLKRIVYSLGWLAALAIAASAGWKAQ
jgi:hypothetical protein